MLLAAFGCDAPAAVMATPDQPLAGFTGAPRDMTCLAGPASNQVRFCFAANAANGDDTSSGDSIYFGSLIVPRHDLPNNPPTVTVPDVVVSATTAESVAIPMIVVADPDAGAAAVSVTLQVEKGTMHVDEEIAGGLATGAIENNHSENVRLTGSLAAINITPGAEGALRYTSHAGFAGPDYCSPSRQRHSSCDQLP